MESHSGLNCNACSKRLIGNCFMTACGHILCHDDGMSAFRNNHDFVCPVCEKALNRQEVTELNFLGDKPSSPNDVKTILSFIVERPSTVLGFLGQVLQFRDQQQVLLTNACKRIKRNAEKDANDLKHKIMRTENYVQEMEGKLRRKDNRIEELEKEFAELRRQRDALQKNYRALREDRSTAQAAPGPAVPFWAARNHYRPSGGMPLPLTPNGQSPYGGKSVTRAENSPAPAYKRSPANRKQNSSYFSISQGATHHAGERYRKSRSRSNSPAKLLSGHSTPRGQRPRSASGTPLRSQGVLPARRTSSSGSFQYPIRPKTPLFNQLQAQSQSRHTGWS